MSSIFLPGQTILLQGDSITDAKRSRENDSELGTGYANLVAAWISASRPYDNLRFLNRGIGGDRVRDLLARWTDDCITLKPDWVSIMIGINDTWRSFDRISPTTCEEYERDYRIMLSRVRDELNAGIIMIEPFVLPYPADRIAWREDLDPKIAAFRRLATEFRARVVPLDGIMNAVAAAREPGFLAQDGVHPTQAGHALIAQHWLRTVGELG
jgi:lysophospholipase L1-like esterase